MQKRKHAQPTIALCVIARDEEALLAECLDSARPYVDEIIVLDTGSTDRTREVAQEHGAKLGQFTWCDDFSAAKNAALDLATADWVLFMDADERLVEGGPCLRELASELPADFHGYAIQMDNQVAENVVTHYATRFFPLRADLRFRHAIHERIEYVADPAATQFAQTSAIRLSHIGYDPALYESRGKDRRNLRLLQGELERNPEDAWALFHLALQHVTRQRFGQALLYLRRLMPHAAQLPARYTAEAYRLQIEALLSLGHFAELERVAAAAEAADQLTPFAREFLATYAITTGQLSLAVKHYQAALEPNAPAGVQAPVGSGSWRTLGQLANVYEQLGDLPASLEALQRAVPLVPLAERARYALITGQVAARLQQTAIARRWLQVAAEFAQEDLQVHVDVLRERLALRGETVELLPLEKAIAEQDWQTAYDHAMVLPVGHAAGAAQLLLLGDHLRERGAADAALDVLNRLLQGGPPSIPLYWRLTQTLSDLGRYEDAATASELLQQLPGAGKSIFGS